MQKIKQIVQGHDFPYGKYRMSGPQIPFDFSFSWGSSKLNSGIEINRLKNEIDENWELTPHTLGIEAMLIEKDVF